MFYDLGFTQYCIAEGTVFDQLINSIHISLPISTFVLV